MSSDTVVIVGGSLAAGRTAETLRRGGHEGAIVMVGAEAHRPYDRPPLSKKFLQGQHPEERLPLRPLAFYEKQKIELRLGARAKALHVEDKELELEGGERIPYDRLVIATGADVRRLRCPGADLEGVHYVRTLEDSAGIRRELGPGKRCVVIGAGVIGAEVAASCREEGLDVAMVELESTPLLRAFGKEIGELYAKVHRERGVTLRCGVAVTQLRGQGRVQEVVLSDGETLACDFVVVGIGVIPATAWLEGSGIALQDGAVLVDEHGRTNLPGIWAAGDVARSYSPSQKRHVCVESIDNAQTQGVAVANDMNGKVTVHDPVPFFWSDQYDLKLQSVGHVGAFDRVVYRGSKEGLEFIAFHLIGEQLRFAIGVNRLKELGAAKKILAAGVVCSDEEYADENVDLGALVKERSAPA